MNAAATIPASTDKGAALARLVESGVIAIMRHTEAALAKRTVKALLAGGVTAIEVTMNTAGALEMIRGLAGEFGEAILLGAGTVLNTAAAEQALAAGARFVVAPTTDLKVIALCNGRQVPVIPGAFTPTEILLAWESGADLVKLFPAGPVGPRYIRDLRGPFPDIPLVPTGGVSLENAADFIRAGATALGIGTALVDRHLVAAQRFADLTERARAFVAAVRAGRRT